MTIHTYILLHTQHGTEHTSNLGSSTAYCVFICTTCTALLRVACIIMTHSFKKTGHQMAYCSWSACTGTKVFPSVPLSRTCFRETDSAVWSRVSQPTFSAPRLNLLITHGLLLVFPRLAVTAFIYLYRQPTCVSPEFVGSCKWGTDDVHCRESAGTGPVFRAMGALFKGVLMDLLILSMPGIIVRLLKP